MALPQRKRRLGPVFRLRKRLRIIRRAQTVLLILAIIAIGALIFLWGNPLILIPIITGSICLLSAGVLQKFYNSHHKGIQRILRRQGLTIGTMLSPIQEPSPLASLQQDHFGNTALTSLLAPNMCHESTDSYQGKLDELIAKAHDGKHHSRWLLRAPNVPTKTLTEEERFWFPSNTPLMMLVKMRDTENALKLVAFYDGASLLHCTPRGNNVLHLAILLGDYMLLRAILHHAIRHGVFDELVNQKNVVGQSPLDIFELLFKTFCRDDTGYQLTSRLDGLNGLCSKLLGGNETEKTNIERGRTVASSFSQTFLRQYKSSHSLGAGFKEHIISLKNTLSPKERLLEMTSLKEAYLTYCSRAYSPTAVTEIPKSPKL